MSTHLFCAHGWIVPKENPMPTSRTSLVRIVEPSDGAISVDALWPQQTARIAPAMVMTCLGSVSQWLTMGELLSHARGFATWDAACTYARECTADQWNFLLEFPEDGVSTITRPEGLPIPDGVENYFPYLILDGWLDRWGHMKPQWRASDVRALDELHRLSGLGGGCMLRCAFKIDEDEITTPIVACWLYATGRTDRMRWAIHPWPEKLPPAPVSAE